jgi:ComF family protein
MDRERLLVVRRVARELACAVLDGLVSPRCPACGHEADGLCAMCRARLMRPDAEGCWRCGEPTVPGSGRCIGDHRPLRGLAFRRSAFGYAGTGGALVRRFKFGGDGAAGIFLLRGVVALARRQLSGWPRQTLVIPVPMHARKRRSRGFDQAARLAEGVGEALELPRGRRVLVRIRDTRPQGDPRTTSREANVAGVFRVARPRFLAGKHVLLVDDVTTSGATARECARVLRAAGARRVGLLTAASG